MALAAAALALKSQEKTAKRQGKRIVHCKEIKPKVAIACGKNYSPFTPNEFKAYFRKDYPFRRTTGENIDILGKWLEKNLGLSLPKVWTPTAFATGFSWLYEDVQNRPENRWKWKQFSPDERREADRFLSEMATKVLA